MSTRPTKAVVEGLQDIIADLQAKLDGANEQFTRRQQEIDALAKELTKQRDMVTALTSRSQEWRHQFDSVEESRAMLAGFITAQNVVIPPALSYHMERHSPHLQDLDSLIQSLEYRRQNENSGSATGRFYGGDRAELKRPENPRNFRHQDEGGWVPA